MCLIWVYNFVWVGFCVFFIRNRTWFQSLKMHTYTDDPITVEGPRAEARQGSFTISKSNQHISMVHTKCKVAFKCLRLEAVCSLDRIVYVNYTIYIMWFQHFRGSMWVPGLHRNSVVQSFVFFTLKCKNLAEFEKVPSWSVGIIIYSQ